MCSAWIQLFLESHTVALFLFDFHLPVCQLRHLAHWNKTLPKNSYIYWNKILPFWFRGVIRTWKESYSKILKNISEYNTGQTALIKYTEGTPTNTKWTIGASFKRKVDEQWAKLISQKSTVDRFRKQAIGNWRLMQIVLNSVLTSVCLTDFCQCIK